MAVYPAYSSTFSGHSGRILRVGRGLHCPFKHISDAISASQPYDRIEIENGEYYESVSICHPLELASTNDDDAPCINARGPCITVNDAGPVLIENIRVVAKGSKPSDSMAVLIVHGSPLIRGCELSAVQVINESCPTITHCKIMRADRGCGLVIANAAGGEYTHNDIGFHPEECVRIQSTGQPNLHNNRILQVNQSRALVMIAGGKFTAECQPVLCDNVISGNGEVSLDGSPDPAVILTPGQLTAPDIHSAECLVHVSWGAKPVLKGNYVCSGIHGFLFGGTVMPPANFNGNRIANCTGWAVAVAEGTGLSMHDCEVQHCAGAVRVFNNRANHFGKLPVDGARAIHVVSHAATRAQHRRASLAAQMHENGTSPTTTPSAQMQLRRAVSEKEDSTSAEAMSAFRKQLVTALRRDETATQRFRRQCKGGGSSSNSNHPSRVTSRRSSAATTPAKVAASVRCLSRSASFRHDDKSCHTPVASLSTLERDATSVAVKSRRAARGTASQEKRAPAKSGGGGDAESDHRSHPISVVMVQCTFRRNFHYGVYVENSFVSVSRCRFVENAIGLVLSRNCAMCTVVENTFEGNAYAALLCTNAAEATVEDNKMTGGGATTTTTATNASLITRGGEGARAAAHPPFPSSSSTARTGHGTAGTASYGVLLQEHSSLTLRNCRISRHARNIAVLGGSALVACSNRLQQGRESHIVVAQGSRVDLTENVLSDSGGAAVHLSGESRGRLCKNHILSSSGEGVAATGHSQAELYDNVLHACQEALSVRGASVMYAEGNAATLGSVGVAVRDARSEIALVGGRVLSTTGSFGLVHGVAALLTVRGTQFEGCLGTGFDLSHGVTLSMEKCSVSDCHNGFFAVPPIPRGQASEAGSLTVRYTKLAGCKGVGFDICPNHSPRVSELGSPQAATASGVTAFTFTLRHCSITDCTKAGVRIAGGGVWCDITANTLVGCLGVSLDVGCGGTVSHNEVDGWHAEEMANGLVGLRLGGSDCSVEVAQNTLVDCVVGVAVEAGARAMVHHNTIVSPVDAGVLVTGQAPDTELRDTVIDRSDGVGVLVQDGACAALRRCNVKSAAVSSVVVGHGGPAVPSANRSRPSASSVLSSSCCDFQEAPDNDEGGASFVMFKDCVFAGLACEVLAHSAFRMQIEHAPTRKAALHSLLQQQGNRGTRTSASYASALVAGRSAALPRGNVSPAVAAVRARRRTSRASPTAATAAAPFLLSAGRPACEPQTTAAAASAASMPALLPVLFHNCQVGGLDTRQCVVALQGSVSFVNCTIGIGQSTPAAATSSSSGDGDKDQASTGTLRQSSRRGLRFPTDTTEGRQTSTDWHGGRRGPPGAVSTREGGKGGDGLGGAAASCCLESLGGGLGVVASGPSASVKLYRCTVERCRTAGAQLASTAACHIQQCLFSDCGVGVECVSGNGGDDATGAALADTRASAAAVAAEWCAVLRRVTIRDCATAGLRCTAGGACILTESTVDQCAVSIALGSHSRLRCEKSVLVRAAADGIAIVGAPHPLTVFEDVHIARCNEFGIRHRHETPPNSSPHTTTEDPCLPTFRRCEIRYCGAGCMSVEGRLVFHECMFHADPAARARHVALGFDSDDSASREAEEDESDALTRPRSTTVCVSGCGAVTAFTQCRFLASSCTRVQLVVGAAASVALTECSFEGRSSVGARAVTVLQPKRLAMVRCGIQGYQEAIVYAPPAPYTVAAVDNSACATTTTTNIAAAAPRRAVAAKRTSTDHEASPLAEIVLDGCEFDDLLGAVFRSEENTGGETDNTDGERKKTSEPSTAAGCEAQRVVDMPPATLSRGRFTLTCLHCSFRAKRVAEEEEQSAGAVVSLGCFCHAAAFHSCAFTDAPRALELDHTLLDAQVHVCSCSFTECAVAMEVQAGRQITVSRSAFARQSVHDIVLHGGQSISVDGNSFEGCSGAGGSLSVCVATDAAYYGFKQFAAARWREDGRKAQRDLVRAWATRVAESGKDTQEWSITRNQFRDGRAGVVVLSSSLARPPPSLCLPAALRITANRFERCSTGLLCRERTAEEDVGGDVDSMYRALARELDGSRKLPVAACRNTFFANRTGMEISTTAAATASVSVCQNTFEQNDTCGLWLRDGATAEVCENAFVHHDGDGTSEAPGAAAADTAQPELEDEVLRHHHDAFAALRVMPGASGCITRNHFKENLVGISFTDVKHVTASDNVFVGNDRGVRIAAAGNEAKGGVSLSIVNNTFLSSIVCDVHASAFTCIPDGSAFAAATATATASAPQNVILLAFNRFASRQVPVSVLVHDYDEGNTNFQATFRLLGNIFTANAQCAVRLARCSTLHLQLMRNLFFAVGQGVVVGPQTRSTALVDNTFGQHTATALSSVENSSLTACRCWFLCYPDHATVLVDQGDQTALVHCRFYSTQCPGTPPNPSVVFTSQCKKSVVSQCAFVGRQPGVLVEGRSSAALSQCLFRGNETGLIARGAGTTVHVDATCTFQNNRFSGVRLLPGCRGAIALLDTGDKTENTVLPMGEHEVEVSQVKKLTGPLAKAVSHGSGDDDAGDEESLRVDMRVATTAELEEQLLGRFVRTICLSLQHIPPSVAPHTFPEEEEEEGRGIDTGGFPPTTASRRDLDGLTTALLNKYSSLLTQHRGTGEAATASVTHTQVAGDGVDSASAAADVAAVLPRNTGKTASRPPPKQRDTNAAIADSVKRAADALCEEVEKGISDMWPSHAPPFGESPQQKTQGHRTTTSTSQETEPAVAPQVIRCTEGCSGAAAGSAPLTGEVTAGTVAEGVALLNVIDGILSAVVQRSEAQRAKRAMQTTGVSDTHPRRRRLSTDGARTDGAGARVASVGRGGGSREVTTAHVSTGRGEMKRQRSMRRANIAVAVAQKEKVWDPYFAHASASTSAAAGDGSQQDRTEGSGAPHSGDDGGPLMPRSEEERARQRDVVIGLTPRRVCYPIKSEDLRYAVFPVSRMPPREKSLSQYALERRRRERAARRVSKLRTSADSPRGEATTGRDGSLAEELSFALPEEEEGDKEEEEALDVSHLFPSYRRERVCLAVDMGFDLFYDSFCLFAEETEAPATPTLRAYEEEEAVPLLGGDSATTPSSSRRGRDRSAAWSRFWEEDERRRAQDAALLRNLAASQAGESSRESLGGEVPSVGGLVASPTAEQPAGDDGAVDQTTTHPAEAPKSYVGGPRVERGAATSAKKRKKRKAVVTEGKTKGALRKAKRKPAKIHQPSDVVGPNDISPSSPPQQQQPPPPLAARVGSASAPAGSAMVAELELVMSTGTIGEDADTGGPALTTKSHPTAASGSEASPNAPAARRTPLGASAHSLLASISSLGSQVVTQVRRAVAPPSASHSRRGSSRDGNRDPSAALSLPPATTASRIDSASTAGARKGEEEEQKEHSQHLGQHDSETPQRGRSDRPPKRRKDGGDGQADAEREPEEQPISSRRCTAPSSTAAKRAKTPVETGSSGLPVTVASSLRAPAPRRTGQPHTPQLGEETLTDPPPPHSDGSRDLWHAINDLLVRSDPPFPRHAEPRDSNTASPSPTIPPPDAAAEANASRPPSAAPVLLPALASAKEEEDTETRKQREEVEDILTLLHWLAERRRYMKPETYEAVFDRILEGTQRVRPFSAKPQETSRTDVGERSEGQDGARVVYVPLTRQRTHLPARGPAQREGDSDEEEAAHQTSCAMVRIVPGRGVVSVSVVELCLADIPPHPAAALHRARCRMATQLAAARHRPADSYTRVGGDDPSFLPPQNAHATLLHTFPPPATAARTSQQALSYDELQRKLLYRSPARGRTLADQEAAPAGGAGHSAPNRSNGTSTTPSFHKRKPHRVKAMAAPPHSSSVPAMQHGEAGSVEFDPANPRDTTPFNVAKEQPYAFSHSFLPPSTW